MKADRPGRKNEHAAALSALGASKGGLARAKKLTSEERSIVARRAAQARWDLGKGGPIPAAVCEAPLSIGDAVLDCAVLEDGTRVLSRAGFVRAIGRTGKAKGGRRYDDESQIPVFLTSSNLKPFIGAELTDNSAPIFFRPVGGGLPSMGYKAQLLPLVCNVFLDAKEANVLLPNQVHIAEACRILSRGFAAVGITALIDEATGYQDIRPRDALAKILEAFVAKELRPWLKTFPAEFYKEMFRLKNWKYADDKQARPGVVGKYTNDLIYARLAPGVLDELRRVTPRNEKGRLKNKLHQRLTDDIGHPKLRILVGEATMIMKYSPSWETFMRRMDEARPRYGDTKLIDFEV